MKYKNLVAAAAATAIAGLASMAAAEEITYNTFMPPLATETTEAQEFFEELAGITDGKLTGRVFVGGQMLGGQATLGGIRDGVVDAGFIVPTLNSSEIPHVAMLPELLPFAKDFWAATGATNETMMVGCKECREDLDRYNAVWLGGHGASPWHLMCTSEITRFDDLSGKKIRVTGGFATRMINALGAVAVALPASEIGAALQQGQVDCAVGNLAWLNTLSLIDSVKGIVDQPVGSYHGLGEFIFNKSALAKLDDEQRSALFALIPKRIAQITKTYADQEVEARAAAEAKGIVFWNPDDAYNSAMDDFRAGELDAVASDIVQLGGSQDARAIVQAHVDRLKKWNDLVKDVKGDTEAFTKLLEDEVFSKIQQ